MVLLARTFPLAGLLRTYSRADLVADCVAGLTVAVMLVPQAMGYAILAGLPPAIGLYACTAPLIVYALLGSSRHLAVGPVAMVSLLVQAQITPIAKGDPDLYIALAIQMALMVGVIQVLMGALRLGVIVNFLSHAVTSGFTSAAAIVIMMSQMKHMLGVKVSGEGSVFLQVHGLLSAMGGAHLLTLSVGIGTVALLVAMRRGMPRAPGPMVVAVVGTALAWSMHLDGNGLAVVGSVPSGLPALGLPELRLDLVPALLPGAVIISLIGFVESIAIANVLAAREGYRVSADRELAALGMANVAAAAVGSYPVTGGLSRTAVNYQAGARTPVASVVTAIVIILTLLFLTPLFHFTPKAVLAALVVVSVAGLVDFRELQHLRHLRPADASSFVVTFLAVLAVDVEKGIAIGIAYSLGQFIWRSARPRIVEVGLVEEDGAFRDITRFAQARTYEGVLIFRVDAALYFANMRFVEDWLRRKLAGRAVRCVVFDLSSVNDMDGVAAMTLREVITLYQQEGIRFAFAGMKGPIRDLVLRAGWPEEHARQVSLPRVIEETGVEPPRE